MNSESWSELLQKLLWDFSFCFHWEVCRGKFWICIKLGRNFQHTSIDNTLETFKLFKSLETFIMFCKGLRRSETCLISHSRLHNYQTIQSDGQAILMAREISFPEQRSLCSLPLSGQPNSICSKCKMLCGYFLLCLDAIPMSLYRCLDIHSTNSYNV